jgi:hypothetical protein
MKTVIKFCGAKVGDNPKGNDCLMCDFFAKSIQEGTIKIRNKQVGCPAEMHIQLYRLKHGKVK